MLAPDHGNLGMVYGNKKHKQMPALVRRIKKRSPCQQAGAPYLYQNISLYRKTLAAAAGTAGVGIDELEAFAVQAV